MKIKRLLHLIGPLLIVAGCNPKPTTQPSLLGTWQLVAATATQKDSTFSTFDPTHKMIKLITPTHFAFLNHAVKSDKDSTNGFTAGGGTYTLADSTYTESLDYYSDKAWEHHQFAFVVRVTPDSLIQKGVEKVDKLGIDRVIVETYKRVSQ